MVNHKLIIGLLLIASTARAAATNYYWDYPETTALESADRLLVYKGTATDRNITGDSLASSIVKYGKNASFGTISASKLVINTSGSLGRTYLNHANNIGTVYQIGGVDKWLTAAYTVSGSTYFTFWNTLQNNSQFYFSDSSLDSFFNGAIYSQGLNTPTIISPIIYGVYGTSGNVTINSNSSNNGLVKFGTTFAYDEALQRLGVGTQSPAATVEAVVNTATDTVQISNLGIRLKGTATVFDDVVIPLVNSKAPAAETPTWTAYKGSEVPAFSATLTNGLYWGLQLPHSYKEGSNIGCHLHVTYPDANAGNSRWTLSYSWANVDGSFPTATTETLTFAAPAAADVHKIHPFSDIVGTGKTVSSVLLGKISRIGGDGADTYAAVIYGVSLDCHVEKDSLGSDTVIGKTATP